MHLLPVSLTPSVKGLLWIVVDQRINTLFCFKLKKSAKETHKLLKVYEDEAITSKSVYGWLKTACNPKNIERVKQLVKNNCRLTKWMIAEKLGIGTESTRLILTKDLRKRKLCCRLAPHCLTPEQREMKLGTCGDLIEMADGDKFPEHCHRRWELVTEVWSRKQMKVRRDGVCCHLKSYGIVGKIAHKNNAYCILWLRVSFTKNSFPRVSHRMLLPTPKFWSVYCMGSVTFALSMPSSWTLVHDSARPHTALVIR